MQNPQNVILQILSQMGRPVNSTRLVKLVYLADYVYFQHFGVTLTGFRYAWDHYGPNAIGNAILEEASKLSRKSVVRCTHSPNIYGTSTAEYKIAPGTKVPSLPPEGMLVVDDVVTQYGKLSTAVITAASKRTAPFKNAHHYDLLKMEQITTPEETTAEDYQRYKEQEQRHGMTSLEELAHR